MGAGNERSIRDVARRGFNLLLGQYSSPLDVARNIAIFRDGVEAKGEPWDPMRVGVTRAFFVTENASEREAALERRLAGRLRQLKLATTPDGRILGGPDRADGDPVEINLGSAIYGPPDEIARKIEALRAAGAGYLLLNGGGSGGGERGRQSLRRFAREVMPAFAQT
jgi:alkanesulfonate monooxygenase SsuD/methylene tetrahydromethanopterin reductase-like flavin-dependent oxidoreductase (luciferase family)